MKIILWICLSTIVITLALYIHALIITPDLYEAKSVYYVEYASDPKVVDGNHTYINQYTWDMWIGTQLFLDMIETFLNETNSATAKPIPARDEIKNALSAKVPSDLRVMETTVRMADPDVTLMVASALEKAVVAFGDAQREINFVRVDEHAINVRPVQTDFSWASMIMTVALLSTIVILSGCYIKELLSDAIWLPRTIRLRFGVPTAGSLYQPCFPMNIKKYVSAYERVGITRVMALPNNKKIVPSEDNTSEESILALLRGCVKDPMTQKWEMVRPILEEPEDISRLKEMDAVVLLIDAGAHMGQRVLCALEFLRFHKCNIAATILWNADERLIQDYYRTPWDCFT
jgi:hypothetical protein